MPAVSGCALGECSSQEDVVCHSSLLCTSATTLWQGDNNRIPFLSAARWDGQVHHALRVERELF